MEDVMEKRLFEVLNHKGGNYILPFFWQHGEEEWLIRDEMQKIYDSGIYAVCVESRPHPDFAGARWWHDMDIIMEEARKRDMKVWVLDDAHFPSGYANGQVAKHPSARKIFLDHYCIDAIGPLKNSSFMINLKTDERLVGVVAGKRDRNDPGSIYEPKDVTDLVKDNMLYWDVPEGLWCVIVIKIIPCTTGRSDYINVIDKEAVKFFLDTAYEPHYGHYKADFGTTFAGFFSDEPEIGNVGWDRFGFDTGIGRQDMVLPWCGELEAMLHKKWQEKYTVNITALWFHIVSASPSSRLIFMDSVTRLYGMNFCTQIGDWCRSHGVEYIGHVIEDEGCHTRLGMGAGHYFRALWGQDMSGIDVVLQQIRPGLDDTPFYRIDGKYFYSGEFFHYGLAKLGASLGHMDSKKQGRTMCEIYGAYGWTEGLKLMKWLTDHMLVNGINYFVPHAFTMKDFPDPDCPPHFYARGFFPQYPYFKYLMDYMNRVCHLLNGGTHVPDVAVLYHAEAEWMGEYQPFEKVGRLLSKSQIDFEVAPIDVLLKSSVKSGQLIIGEETCKALIIPESRYLPGDFINWCHKAEASGLMILWINRNPEGIGGENDITPDPCSLVKISMEDLVPFLKKMKMNHMELSKPAPDLRYYHYKHSGGEYFIFFNESPSISIETKVKLPSGTLEVFRYDAFDNVLVKADYCDEELKLNLVPYESYIAYCGPVDGYEVYTRPLFNQCRNVMPDESWKLSMKAAGSDEVVTERELTGLVNLAADGEYPYFSGTMEYETDFFLEEKPDQAYLDFGEVYETLELWINGKSAGVRIAPPYQLHLKGLLQQGDNHLKVRVVNTLVHSQRDPMSVSMPVEPSGLLGPVKLYY
jgi:hypothetical protein